MCEKGVAFDGFPSLKEIKDMNGWPDEARFARGPVAIIECVQEIPCNPCEKSCPYGAIHVGQPITNVPRLERNICVGCGLCVTACSGLAIFVVDKSCDSERATVTFPFEYFPLPSKGDSVQAVARDGSYVCEGIVLRVSETKRSDHTAAVTIEIPRQYADLVRSIKRIGQNSHDEDFQAIEWAESIDDDMLVCRCEEITAGEIRKAVREYKGTSVNEVRRRARAGMGLCQGKSCGTLVARIISEETGIDVGSVGGATDRPPVRPLTFGELSNGVSS
jgi:Fe-S-cluster-containing hydrogenase component 2/bacterioferritin-associated ferredoxin